MTFFNIWKITWIVPIDPSVNRVWIQCHLVSMAHWQSNALRTTCVGLGKERCERIWTIQTFCVWRCPNLGTQNVIELRVVGCVYGGIDFWKDNWWCAEPWGANHGKYFCNVQSWSNQLRHFHIVETCGRSNWNFANEFPNKSISFAFFATSKKMLDTTFCHMAATSNSNSREMCGHGRPRHSFVWG